MNVTTIIIGREEAERKLAQYKSITGKRRLAEDAKLRSLYTSISKGARVLNLASAFRHTGLSEKGEPRLAIARADWPRVYGFKNPHGADWRTTRGTIGFSDKERWNGDAVRRNILLPDDTVTWPEGGRVFNAFSPVPHIPPDVRPKFALHNYHILFEVKRWKAYPVDPFLLRRIGGLLFMVEAEWELTELEAALLSSLTQGT